MSASSPSFTSDVFSFIPESRAAFLKRSSSMLSVVRICLNMHHSCIQWQAGQWAWRLPLSTFWRARKAGPWRRPILQRGAKAGAGPVPRGAEPEENGASFYGRDPKEGFAEAVAWPLAGDQAQRSGVCAMCKVGGPGEETLSEWCRRALLDAARLIPLQDPEAAVDPFGTHRTIARTSTYRWLTIRRKRAPLTISSSNSPTLQDSPRPQDCF